MDTMNNRRWLFQKMVLVGLIFFSLSVSLTCQTNARDRAARVSSIQDRPITTLRDLNQALVDIAAEVKPAVVTVSTERIFTARTLSPFSSPFG
ncbi:MAG: hypothetical protein ACE5K8_01805, partial [Candidatus Zixiibacteriota bacterium]